MKLSKSNEPNTRYQPPQKFKKKMIVTGFLLKMSLVSIKKTFFLRETSATPVSKPLTEFSSVWQSTEVCMAWYVCIA